MNASDLTALLLYATAMSFTPGPNTTLSTALAAQGGLRHAMPFVAAVPFGWGAIFVLCALTVGSLAADARIRLALVVLAALYMLWLAWMLWHRTAMTALREEPMRIGFWQGVALQFVNGKVWLNALTISATWIARDAQTLPRLLTVLPLMMMFGLTSNFTYALAGSALRQWLAVGQRLRWFYRVLALVLVATALWILMREF